MGGGQRNTGAGGHFAHHRNGGRKVARQQHEDFGLIGLLRQALFYLRRNLRQRLACRRNASGEWDRDAPFSVDRLFGKRSRERRRRNPRRGDLDAPERGGGGGD